MSMKNISKSISTAIRSHRPTRTTPRTHRTLSSIPHSPPRSILPYPLGPGSSPIATSSKVTLDDLPFFAPQDPIILSLTYASDQELIDALLIERTSSIPGIVSPYNTQWSSTVDPAFAFLALRDRSIFPAFVANIRPSLKRIWNGLKSSGMHQILATDLLLRNPDPRVLRDVLELDVASGSSLRYNIVASVYRELHPHITAGRVGQISRVTSFRVAEALMAKSTGPDPILLTEVWKALYSTSTIRDSPQSLLAITLELVKQREIDGSVKMIKQLAEADRLPDYSVGRVDPKHPEALALSVLSIVLRTCMEYKLGDLARTVVEEMILTMEKSKCSDSTFEIILDFCRGEIITRDRECLEWGCDTMIRLSKLDNPPLIPSSLINDILDIGNEYQSYRLITSIDPLRRGPPSPPHILRLATAFPRLSIIEPLLHDIDRSAFAAQRVPFLRILSDLHLRVPLRKYLTLWSPLTLDAATMLSLVQVFRNSPSDKPLVRDLIKTFTSHATTSSRDQHAIVKANILCPDSTAVWSSISKLNPSDNSVQLLTNSLWKTKTRISLDISRMAIENGMRVSTPLEVVLRNCLKGEWHMLDRVWASHFKGDERVLVTCLKKIKNGQFSACWKGLEALEAGGKGMGKGKVPREVYVALMERAIGLVVWKYAMRAWDVLPKENKEGVDLEMWRLGKRIVEGVEADLAVKGRFRYHGEEKEFVLSGFERVKVDLREMGAKLKTSQKRRGKRVEFWDKKEMEEEMADGNEDDVGLPI